jgi:hypothetical protein
MNEAETRAEHIDPALKAANWGSRVKKRYYQFCEYLFSGSTLRNERGEEVIQNRIKKC